jgi:hypothetical protein
MKRIALILLCVLSPPWVMPKERPPITYTIPLPPKPDYSPLAWLMGEWSGKTTGPGSQGEIHLSVSLGLDGRFMIFHEEVLLGCPRCDRRWWMDPCHSPRCRFCRVPLLRVVTYGRLYEHSRLERAR